MKECENCKYYYRGCYYKTIGVSAEKCSWYKHFTNFEWHTTTPKKLAKFIDEAIEKAAKDIGIRGCPIYEKPVCEKGVSCAECIEKWLESEAIIE